MARREKKAKRCDFPACASRERRCRPRGASFRTYCLPLERWKCPLRGETSLETHRRRRSLRQVRRKTSLQTHRRPGNRAFLDAIASVCAAARRTGRQFASLQRWTGRQFTSLESGQGGNLRRAEGAISPLAGAKRGVYCHTRKTGVWTLPVVRKKDAPTNGGGEAAEGRRGEEKKGLPAPRNGSRSVALGGGGDRHGPETALAGPYLSLKEEEPNDGTLILANLR